MNHRSEARKQLSDMLVYSDVQFKDKTWQDLIVKNNVIYKKPKREVTITEKQITTEYKKATKLGKMHPLT